MGAAFKRINKLQTLQLSDLQSLDHERSEWPKPNYLRELARGDNSILITTRSGVVKISVDHEFGVGLKVYKPRISIVHMFNYDPIL